MISNQGGAPDWEDEKNYKHPVVHLLKFAALLLSVLAPLAAYRYYVITTKPEPAIKEVQLIRAINNDEEDIKIELRMINHRLAELEKEVFYLERKGN